MKNILLLVMAISLLGGMVVLSYFFTPLAWGAGLLWLCLTLLWLWSLLIKDSSIIDSFWGMGFVILAWLWYGLLPDSNPELWCYVY
jgi:steroid 5-alpha reductase family enzyme